jgi:YbbR domain-containing protein
MKYITILAMLCATGCAVFPSEQITRSYVENVNVTYFSKGGKVIKVTIEKDGKTTSLPIEDENFAFIPPTF